MRYIILTLCVNLLLAPVYPVFAAEENKTAGTQEAPAKVSTSPVAVSKSIQGSVETIRSNYITIIYKQDKGGKEEVVRDYEAVFPVDDKTKFVYKKKLTDFVEGDKVGVVYDETSWVDDKGVGRLERRAREIRFIKPATKGLQSK